MIDKFLLVAGFGLFCFLQAAFVNGVFDLFKGYMDNGKPHGNLGYLLFHKFIDKHDKKNWAKPLFTCPKCMSSVYGALTFWPVVIKMFGFDYFEIIIFFYNIIILVYLNFYLYKKV